MDGKVKICFLTASEYIHEQIRKEHGYDEFNEASFLKKPIEIEDLIRAINRLVESE